MKVLGMVCLAINLLIQAGIIINWIKHKHKDCNTCWLGYFSAVMLRVPTLVFFVTYELS